MYKILAIVLLIIFVFGVTTISVGVFGNLRIYNAPEWGMWAAALFIFVISLPAAIRLGDTLELLWDYD